MKRQWLATVSLLFVLANPFWNANAMAEAVNAADAKSIQAVVQSQLIALANDDADRAFALTTVSTRAIIGNADNFLQMIKEEFAPIYHNRRAIFSPAEIIEGDMLQVVRITDDENHVWVAIYRMERDEDGYWKIDDCRLLETTSTSV